MASGKVDETDKHRVLLTLEPSATRPTHLTYGPDNYVYSATRGMDTLYVDPWLRNADGYAALTFNRYPIADHNVTAYENVNSNFLRIENNDLIVESATEVDSIIVYSVLGRMAIRTAGSRCPIGSLPAGIYSIRVLLRGGDGFSAKVAIKK